MLIVAITGMPGAGKSTASKALEDTGLTRIAMGDVIRAETKRRGLQPDDKGLGAVMKELRAKYGNGAIAEICLPTVEKLNAPVVVIDGIRSMAEVHVFERVGRVLLIAIVASPIRRFELLKERARSDDPLTLESFRERDARELSVGIGEPIALADEAVPNEHNSPEQLDQRVLRLVEHWIKEQEHQVGKHHHHQQQ